MTEVNTQMLVLEPGNGPINPDAYSMLRCYTISALPIENFSGRDTDEVIACGAKAG